MDSDGCAVQALSRDGVETLPAHQSGESAAGMVCGAASSNCEGGVNTNDLSLNLRVASGSYRSPMSTIHEDAEAIRSDPRLRHFASLDEAGKREAVLRMYVDGHSVHGIAAATGLSVEAVALILRSAA